MPFDPEQEGTIEVSDSPRQPNAEEVGELFDPTWQNIVVEESPYPGDPVAMPTAADAPVEVEEEE
jgi:hypothetical protein